MKKFYTVKVVEKDRKDIILDKYEVGCWDILTNTFAELVFEITRTFVDSRYTCNSEICENIIKHLLEFNYRKYNVFF